MQIMDAGVLCTLLSRPGHRKFSTYKLPHWVSCLHVQDLCCSAFAMALSGKAPFDTSVQRCCRHGKGIMTDVRAHARCRHCAGLHVHGRRWLCQSTGLVNSACRMQVRRCRELGDKQHTATPIQIPIILTASSGHNPGYVQCGSPQPTNIRR